MSHGASAEPDLTPILDLVFQLITFFMLVVNFKVAALDTSLKLPVVGSAKPVASKVGDMLVLNVDKEGNLSVYGQKKTGKAMIARYLEIEAGASRMLASKSKPDIQPGDELPTTIVIRADKSIPFSLLNSIITKCQEQGFRQFTLKAMNK